MEQINYQNNATNSHAPLVQDNKALAVVALVLSVVCCNIISIVFGILAIVKSNDVTKFAAMGQHELALSASKNSKLFSWIAIGLLVLGVIIQVVAIAAVGGVEGYREMLEQMMNK